MTARELIAVDVGNSWVKLGLFAVPLAGSSLAGLPKPLWTEQYQTAHQPPDSLQSAVRNRAVTWHVSSVHRDGAERLRQWLESYRPDDPVRWLSFRDLPIEVRVDFPDRVGIDRLTAAVAANALRDPSHSAIVVASGTAITVNLISADGAFGGGAILPGFRMQAQALFGADQLPLAEFAPEAAPPSPLGRNTNDAIRSGLYWGTVGAVRELIAQLSAGQESPVDVFVTGGDSGRLAGELGGTSRFVSNMVLCGIALAAR